MMIPLVVLSIMSIIAGYVLEHFFAIHKVDSLFWNGSIFNLGSHGEHGHISAVIKFMPMVISLGLIAISYKLFLNSKIPQLLGTRCGVLYKISNNKYYFDEIYNVMLVKPTKFLSKKLLVWDKSVVDALFVKMYVKISCFMTSSVNKTQSGYITNYLSIMILFVVLISILLMKV